MDERIKLMKEHNCQLGEIKQTLSEMQENKKLEYSQNEKINTSIQNFEKIEAEGFENVLDEIRYNHEESMYIMKRNLEALIGIGELLINSLSVEYCQRYNEALNNYKNERFEKCLEVLKKAEDLKSDDCRVYLLRGHAHEKLNQLNEALASYIEASRTVPTNNRIYKAHCLYLISWVYFYMGNIDMAINEIRETLRLHDIPTYSYQYAAFLAYRQPKLLKE